MEAYGAVGYRSNRFLSFSSPILRQGLGIAYGSILKIFLDNLNQKPTPNHYVAASVLYRRYLILGLEALVGWSFQKFDPIRAE